MQEIENQTTEEQIKTEEEPIKSGKLFYSIGEVSKMFDLRDSTLRYWEKEFPTYIKPKKNNKGDRNYTQKDIDNIKLIHHLVRECNMKIKGAKDLLKNKKDVTESKFEVIKKLKNLKDMITELKDSL